MYEKALLHVGYDKTGTTALQWAATSLRADLKVLGIDYPQPIQDNNHLAVASAFFTDPTKSKFNLASGRASMPVDQLRREDQHFLATYQSMMKDGTGLVFLSFEGFIELSEEEHSRLRAWLLGLAQNVEVLVYVRNPVKYAASAVCQRVRTGRSFNIPNHRYDVRIPRLQRVYGQQNVLVREYDKQKLVGGDIRTDCFTVLGMDRATADNLTDKARSQSHADNTSISMHAVGVADALYTSLENTEFTSRPGSATRFQRAFDDALAQLPGPPFRLSRRDVNELLKKPEVISSCNYLFEEFGIDFRPDALAVDNERGTVDRMLYDLNRQQGLYAGIASILSKNLSCMSWHPKGYIASLTREITGQVGQIHLLAIDIVNEEDQDWRTSDRFPLRIGYYFSTADTPRLEEARAEIPTGRVLANQTTNVALEIQLPDLPGEYQLTISLLHENLFWFEEESSDFSSAILRVTVGSDAAARR